jgi:hypothetical protein
MATLNLHIFAAENIYRFMNYVCALLAANSQTGSNDSNMFN